MFYKWYKHDFIEVPATELKKGDELAYGGGGNNVNYGTVLLEHVTVVPDWGVLVQYELPVGAVAQSSEKDRIAVTWQGSKPLIQVSQDLSLRDLVMIRKK